LIGDALETTMFRFDAHFVDQIFADAKRPGYQGSLEVISFLIVSAMIAGSYVAAAAMLLYALY